MLDAVTKAPTGSRGYRPRTSRTRTSSPAAGSPGRTPTTPTTYAQTAAIADIEVNKKTGKITVKHVYQAVSAGLAVSLDGVENQIVGGVTQILSRLLDGAVPLRQDARDEPDFVSYPILRFKDAPKVTPIVIQWNTLPTARRRASRWPWSPRPPSPTRSSTRPACACAPHHSRPARVRATLAAGGAGTAGLA